MFAYKLLMEKNVWGEYRWGEGMLSFVYPENNWSIQIGLNGMLCVCVSMNSLEDFCVEMGCVLVP